MAMPKTQNAKVGRADHADIFFQLFLCSCPFVCIIDSICYHRQPSCVESMLQKGERNVDSYTHYNISVMQSPVIIFFLFVC